MFKVNYKHFASKYDEWWNRPPSCADSLNYCCPLAVARLYSLGSTTLFRACENHLSLDPAHHKAGLIEVIHIFNLNAVLLLNRLNERELRAYNVWVLV